jgi:TRAP-type uncharacterized transport system substrate-binding protein
MIALPSFARVLFRSAAATLLMAAAMAPGGAEAQAGGERPVSAEKVNRGVVSIMTGRVDSTASRLAADLADVLDDGATRRLLPILGKGSLQNLTDLRLLRGIDLAVLQIDVLTDLRDRKIAPGIENSFTYVTRLANEELHLLAGEGVTSIQELAGKRVNVGVPGSGAAVTVANVFQRLKIAAEITTFDQASALEKLKAGEIAAVAVVAGKPAPAFGAQALPAGLHFLPVPMSDDLRSIYAPASLTSDDYPGLVPAAKPVETIAVGTMLAAANLAPDSERYRNMANLVDALFTQFDKLLEPGRHPKWREVDIRAEMPGFRRFPPADAWLKRNPVETQAIADAQMKEIFIRFLEERSKLSGGAPLTPQRKEELYAQFQRWQQQQRPR